MATTDAISVVSTWRHGAAGLARPTGRAGEAGHQSAASTGEGRPGRAARRPGPPTMRRATGAAVEPPKPASSITTATTYCGLLDRAEGHEQRGVLLARHLGGAGLAGDGNGASGKPAKAA